ncbi:hypothetical protein NHX12_013686 [Muraenolepis orangiensis]|uniref:G-protein coupled receptors family 1 profile domain-containing protein n=1 Tax=Muraenolepis orangiensis TaxID=630683 RepID=A0A9Q0DAF7_9TELE|nr:hypothetical protein NHX12_013686 [Muraenolepis orangiensis]
MDGPSEQVKVVGINMTASPPAVLNMTASPPAVLNMTASPPAVLNMTASPPAVINMTASPPAVLNMTASPPAVLNMTASPPAVLNMTASPPAVRPSFPIAGVMKNRTGFFHSNSLQARTMTSPRSNLTTPHLMWLPSHSLNASLSPGGVSLTTSHVVPNGTSIVSNSVATALGAVILSLVFMLGLPGNLFIVWSVLARARKRSVTTLLILNLAYADGSLMALTPFFLVYLVMRSWVFGDTLCKILFYLCLANMYASIMLITLMSLHRLVAVVWPRRVRGASAARRVALRAVAVVWVLVLVAAVPALLFREQRVGQAANNQVCDSYHETKAQVVLHYTSELLLGFIIPYPVIVGSYICILRRIRQTKFQRRVRSEKLILAIVVTFCVFWLPYHIINMVQVAAALCPKNSESKRILDKVWQTCRAVTAALAFISSCANPVLYVFAGKSYIRRDGLAFMARLFEGTTLDSVGTRKSRQHSRRDSRERDAKGVMLKDRDMDPDPDRDQDGEEDRDGDDSSYTAHSSSNQLSSNCINKNGQTQK